MNWQTPSFEVVDMNAEIGGYQGDDEGDYLPPFVDTQVLTFPDA